MITNQLDALLKELEPFFKCPLQSDQNNSCLIKMSTGIEIQIELDRYGDHVIIGTRLGVIPAGRYRELVFREALKSNYLHPSFTGVFAFSKRSGNLLFFTSSKFATLNQEKMVSVLTLFIARAQAWAQALGEGTVPSADVFLDAPLTGKSGLFGLIR